VRWAAGAIEGFQRFYTGELDAAVAELEIATQQMGTESVVPFPQDPGVVSLACLALADLFQGRLDQADDQMAGALANLDRLGGTRQFTAAWVLCWAAWLYQLRGELDRALRYAEDARRVSTTSGFAVWAGAAVIHEAIARADLGDDAAVDAMRDGIEMWRAAGAGVMLPYYQSRHAHALLTRGRLTEAAEVIESAWILAESTEERFWNSEVLRIEGLIHRASDEPAAATRAFTRARTEARRTAARWLEWRVALDGADSGIAEPGGLVEELGLSAEPREKRAVVAGLGHEHGWQLHRRTLAATEVQR
jgi:ATP/maltotriose-dependent transcriptional regulator MalT